MQDDLLGLFATYNLTLREQEIYHLLAQGLSNKEIQGHLGLERLNTLTEHLTRLYEKLDVDGRGPAMRLYWQVVGGL